MVEASPAASVIPLTGLTEAPVPEALQVTVAPTSGWPDRVTSTRMALGSAWPTGPLWLSPLTGALATVSSGGGGGEVPPSLLEQASCRASSAVSPRTERPAIVRVAMMEASMREMSDDVHQIAR
jgi:hypothetical protein